MENRPAPKPESKSQLTKDIECDEVIFTWHKLPINLSKLVIGDFAAGAAMITFGAILGKANF